MTDDQYCQILIATFNEEFKDLNTLLIGGFDEPFYLAKNSEAFSEIQFRENFPRSALHEVAHWCVAGPERRKQDDFGYWYLPDDRNANQQEDFQRVEKKPQALEMLFSIAANYPFQVSLDNLSQSENDLPAFRDAVTQQATEYCSKGLPERAAVFFQTLADYYNGPSLALATDAISKQTNPNKILAT